MTALQSYVPEGSRSERCCCSGTRRRFQLELHALELQADAVSIAVAVQQQRRRSEHCSEYCSEGAVSIAAEVQ